MSATSQADIFIFTSTTHNFFLSASRNISNLMLQFSIQHFVISFIYCCRAGFFLDSLAFEIPSDKNRRRLLGPVKYGLESQGGASCSRRRVKKEKDSLIYVFLSRPPIDRT